MFSAVFLTNDSVADANSDGGVNFLDLVVFRDYFLSAPGPAGVARWIGALGNWADKTNWLPAEVPDVIHHVVIDVPGDVVVTLTPESYASVSSLEWWT